MDNQNNNNSRYHLHNIMSSGQIIESVFRFKKIYSYLIPRKKSFIPGNTSRKLKLINIGFICLYCGYITFNSSFQDNKKHLQDQV